MRATVMFGAGDVRIESVPDASIIEPTDAVVIVTRACICGSDLWPYQKMEQSENGRLMGHEAIGIVEAVGADVMGTGHHAAVIARVDPGKTAAVVGDGAVGLCAVIAARPLGAEQIIILGRHPDRIALAREFGATDVVSERGAEAVERVRELTAGFGVHSVLECVGTEQSMHTAISIARPGGAVGRVGVPQEQTIPGSEPAFYNNVMVGGGPAPVRAYIEELLPDVLEGRINPGRVFDRTVSLDQVPGGYRAMNEREAIKVMLKP
jgi:threonine dehydrogenase-like Zn-dependent dehydrogenase